MKHAMHNLSNTVKMSANMGELLPIGCIEVLPGDVFDHSTSVLLRTQPLLAPVMHEVDCKIHHWFVNTRQLWENFPEFITGGPDGADDTVAPYVTTPAGSGFAVGSLADYLGVPTGIPNIPVSALPFRAYAHIYNNYYRDQDLIPELAVSDGDGADTTTSVALQLACWEKDYFTSARPTPQKGPAVSIPLSGDAPVKGLGVVGATPSWSTTAGSLIQETGGTTWTVANTAGNRGSSGVVVRQDASNPNSPNVYADSEGISIDVEDLRHASALQMYQENLSRFGSNYVDRLMAAFGVRPKSLELDLPLYIGGGQEKISISEVLATAEGASVDVGDMKGHGIAAMRSNRYRYAVPEHGFIISLLTVRPRTQYIQGLNKMWSRNTKEDYYQPELAHLGQQPILNKEVSMGHSNPEGVFGYQDAYDSYRFIEGRVSGEFRDTLDYWHMARKWATQPALNADFVRCNATDRIYAVPAADQLYILARHRLSAKRRVIKYAKPMLF